MANRTQSYRSQEVVESHIRQHRDGSRNIEEDFIEVSFGVYINSNHIFEVD